MQSFIYKIWYEKHPLMWCLLPFTIVFYVLSSLRKQLYKWDIKSSSHPNVPVLVVGNISVGGNGKTPVVLKTVQWLVELGYTPGILSRGYGGTCTSHPHNVIDSDSSEWVGDEPKLMALRNLCPVMIDPIRTRGAKALCNKGCDVIVCDDGLQHYKLTRDIEWVVMDDRAVGNGWLLPMGPLRELPSRLSTVNAVIHNGNKPYYDNAFKMSLRYTRFVNIVDSTLTMNVADFVAKYQDEAFHAIAGIGSPQRFFDSLIELGFTQFEQRAFIDHHVFSRSDISNEMTIMTEKDSVKCKAFAHKKCWYLEVDATLPNELKALLIKRLCKLKTHVKTRPN